MNIHPITYSEANDYASHLIGIKEGEDRLKAAEKTLAFVTEAFGANHKEVRSMKKMVERYKARLATIKGL